MSKLKQIINGPWPFVAPTPIERPSVRPNGYVDSGWGWGSRLIEIATTPLGIMFWTLVWIARVVQWPMDRLMNGRDR